MHSHGVTSRSARAIRRQWVNSFATAALLAAPAVIGPLSRARALDRKAGAYTSGARPEFVAGIPATRAVAPASLIAALAAVHRNIPAFSRQTGLACSSCHYQFPQLTPFGRLFKLNGYTLTGLQTIGQPGDSAGKESLKLTPIPALAVMLVSSVTTTAKSLPGAQNGTAAFPDQFSIFAAGQITPNIGAFTQFTYAAVDGALGIDNFDIRYANHGTVNDHEMIYGLTLHNNPTVQDVWNTVPAWVYPFMSSSTAPSPIASTLIDGGLGQQVVGLGAYSLYNGLLYTELTAYRSAPQGLAMPLDSSATNVTSGVIPYWRVALQHESQTTSLMLGTFGFDAHLYPTGISGTKNHYTDVAVDAQVEQRQGPATWIGRASYIHERQQLIATQSAGGAENIDQTLSTARASVAYLPNLRYGATLGYFQTTGTTDEVLYAEEAALGSRTGSPNTSGLTGEINYNAWQNVRVGLQYVAYNKFNGASTAYDLSGGRNASDNNTLYLYHWLAF
jgi:hypothetical protein